MTVGWTFNGRENTGRDHTGRFVRSDGSRRRKAGKSGRSGSGAMAMLNELQLAEHLISLEDQCELYRARCADTPAKRPRTRDCTKIHGDMKHTCAVLGDIVRELLELEPHVNHQPRTRLAELLEARSKISLTPRSLGRWPYSDAIEAAMVVELAAPQSREARVRKRHRELPRRMLILVIQQKESERDGLDAMCQLKATAFAQDLTPLP